jgi:hypothetical protein
MARSTTASAALALQTGIDSGVPLQDYYVNGAGSVSIGSGRPINRSTLVQTAQRRAATHDFEGVTIPNMVEMQLESYQWFLNTGLRELFTSFSPIEDFHRHHVAGILRLLAGRTQVRPG